jgi:hypothetical protein
MSLIKDMLGLIHNIRVDRIRKDHSHSFKKNLNNYTNSELSAQSNHLNENCLLSNYWLELYRKQ